MASPKEVFMQMLAKKKNKGKGVAGEAKAEGESLPFEKKEKKVGDKDDKGKKKMPFPPKKGGM